jgi:hypothetical protein
LDAEKRVYFLSCFPGKKSWPHYATKLQTKKSQNDHFKANPRLVKIVIAQKSY